MHKINKCGKVPYRRGADYFLGLLNYSYKLVKIKMLSACVRLDIKQDGVYIAVKK